MTSHRLPKPNFLWLMCDELRPDGRGWPQRFCVREGSYRLDRSTRIDGQVIDSNDADADVFLADSRTDPEEVCNLTDKPACREVHDRLLSLLENHIADAADPELDDFYEACDAPGNRLGSLRARSDRPGLSTVAAATRLSDQQFRPAGRYRNLNTAPPAPP